MILNGIIFTPSFFLKKGLMTFSITDLNPEVASDSFPFFAKVP